MTDVAENKEKIKSLDPPFFLSNLGIELFPGKERTDKKLIILELPTLQIQTRRPLTHLSEESLMACIS